MLGRSGFPLEVAAAQVCREAGAHVSTNLRRAARQRYDCAVTGLPGQGRPTTRGLCWRKLIVGRSAPTLNCPGMGAGLAWWSLLQRLEAGGALRPPTSWSAWRRPKLLPPLMCCRAVQQAYIRRWSALLACSAVRAFTASLLHEVVCEARFL